MCGLIDGYQDNERKHIFETVAVLSIDGHLFAQDNSSKEEDTIAIRRNSITQPELSMFFVHNDHLGTPQVITDENQDIVWQAQYDPFGTATVTKEIIINNIRFPGQYFDKETGLHYNYQRYYDPYTGRYITIDPIGLAGGLNTYGYVNGNPLKYTDPLGLRALMCRQPLHALGGIGGRSGPDILGNPLYHQYLEVQDAQGNVIGRGGQDRSGGPWSDGKPSQDDGTDPNNQQCYKEKDNQCLDQCVLDNINNPTRPFYGLAGPGTNCQEWADDIWRQCTLQCSRRTSRGRRL